MTGDGPTSKGSEMKYHRLTPLPVDSLLTLVAAGTSPPSPSLYPYSTYLNIPDNVPVSHLGHPGVTAETLLSFSSSANGISTIMRSKGPGTLAIILLGTNDLGASMAEATLSPPKISPSVKIAESVLAIHSLCHALNCPTLAVSIPPSRYTQSCKLATEVRESVNEKLKSFSRNNENPLCLGYVALGPYDDSKMCPDGLHYNPAGYESLASAVSSHISNNGYLSPPPGPNLPLPYKEADPVRRKLTSTLPYLLLFPPYVYLAKEAASKLNRGGLTYAPGYTEHVNSHLRPFVVGAGGGGRILEVGAGRKLWALTEGGIYSGDERVTFLEPGAIGDEAKGKAEGVFKTLPTYIGGKLEDAAGTFDLVISVFTLCSVDDLEASVRSIHALLSNGGTYAFVEHVLAEPGGYRNIQNTLTPLQSKVADNCHLNRDTARVVREVFGNLKGERRREEGMWPVGEVYYGSAIKT